MLGKLFVVSLLVAVVALTASAAPEKRATCTFLGDAGCEAHCYLLNRQGGWCDDHNVCNCRSETIVG
ncbi:hypothetical protein DPMN_174519 [Dreissena polymorpha]|uniref:Invertebrate defensins family profile domain-containing protein n=1 Tax=Dreissena polymorpha TaxID=45954 RepID=A0A9D4IH72_DREPO|nr:hypothetical protein DPMN_174519 [Dreissena polymorpha]